MKKLLFITFVGINFSQIDVRAASQTEESCQQEESDRAFFFAAPSAYMRKFVNEACENAQKLLQKTEDLSVHLNNITVQQHINRMHTFLRVLRGLKEDAARLPENAQADSDIIQTMASDIKFLIERAQQVCQWVEAAADAAVAEHGYPLNKQ